MIKKMIILTVIGLIFSSCQEIAIIKYSIDDAIQQAKIREITNPYYGKDGAWSYQTNKEVLNIVIAPCKSFFTFCIRISITIILCINTYWKSISCFYIYNSSFARVYSCIFWNHYLYSIKLYFLISACCFASSIEYFIIAIS